MQAVYNMQKQRCTSVKQLIENFQILSSHSFRLLQDLIDITNHIKGSLRHIIMFTVNNLFKSSDTICKRNKLSGLSSKDLSDMEWLRHELLYFTCTRYSKFIIFGKFIHTKDSNDILQSLVILKDLLSRTCNFIML